MLETHSSVIFLIGALAFKLKKPVDLGFLDWTSRPARQLACSREVELNRRLAPDVYLGVADVKAPDGSPLDHLVMMRRMPADRMLSTLAAGGAALHPEIREVAQKLAEFHASAETSCYCVSCSCGPFNGSVSVRFVLTVRWRRPRASTVGLAIL